MDSRTNGNEPSHDNSFKNQELNAGEVGAQDTDEDNFEGGDLHTQIEIEAGYWLKVMTDGKASNADIKEFLVWLQQEKAHERAYNNLRKIWYDQQFKQELKEVHAIRERAREEALRETYWGRVVLVVGKLAGGKPKSGMQQLADWVTYRALAVTMIVATVAWSIKYAGLIQSPPEFYQTGVGEQRTVALGDGSIVELNTDTRMRVAFDRDSRKISIVRGDAYFDVVRDGRPFIVSGGTGQVKVLGTAFEVRVSSRQMEVAVERGRVEVSAQRDSQGLEIMPQQRVTVTHYRLGEVVYKGAAGVVADWRDGTLEFNNKALSEVIAELDKYYGGNISLDDVGLSGMRVNGKYNVQNIRKALQTLALSTHLNYRTSDAGDIVFFDKNSASPQN